MFALLSSRDGWRNERRPGADYEREEAVVVAMVPDGDRRVGAGSLGSDTLDESEHRDEEEDCLLC